MRSIAPIYYVFSLSYTNCPTKQVLAMKWSVPLSSSALHNASNKTLLLRQTFRNTNSAISIKVLSFHQRKTHREVDSGGLQQQRR